MQGSNLRHLPCEFTDLNPESRKSITYAPWLRASVTQIDRNRQEGTLVRHVLVTVAVTGWRRHHAVTHRDAGHGPFGVTEFRRPPSRATLRARERCVNAARRAHLNQFL